MTAPRLTWRTHKAHLYDHEQRPRFGLYRAGERLGMVQPGLTAEWYMSLYTNSALGLLCRMSSTKFATAEEAKAALLDHVKARLAAKESA